jgi:hypothetical protein
MSSITTQYGVQNENEFAEDKEQENENRNRPWENGYVERKSQEFQERLGRERERRQNIPVIVNGKVVGRITVYYEETTFSLPEKATVEEEDDKTTEYHGVQITLLYKSFSKKYKDFQWLQTITTNEPGGCGVEQYVDPCKMTDNYPFYRTKSEIAVGWQREPGFDSKFYDQPGREAKAGSTANWKSELSLFGRNSSGAFVPLITLSYGFSVQKNGDNVITTLYKPTVVTASDFQKKYFEIAQKR